MSIHSLIQNTPKAELHYHIDCIGPELCWKFTQRNHLEMPFHSLEECRAFYQYHDLEGFIRVVLTAAQSMQTEEDCFNLVIACAEDMARQNIVRREVMFDYLACFASRGVALDTVMRGFQQGLAAAKNDNPNQKITFIANLDRTEAVEENCKYLKALQRYRADLPILAVGLDSQETGYPAANQAAAFQLAKELGLHRTAHTGETEGPEEIRSALHTLELERIDHGIRAAEDPELMRELADRNILLTLCPDSNIVLGNSPDWPVYPIRKLLDAGVRMCINSDDPPYFPHDLCGNLEQLAANKLVTEAELSQLMQNAMDGCFH